VPVEILGFDNAPEAGDQFAVVENEARAREITDYRVRKRRETLGAAGGGPRTLEQMMQQFKDAAGKKEFNLVIKGDVQGSVEAIVGSLDKLATACEAGGIEFILPAHGYVLGFAHQAITHLKAHRLKREAKIAAAMQALPQGSLQEWVEKAYDDVPSRLWPVAARSLQAHVDHIREQALS
jgi:hypothetical protein